MPRKDAQDTRIEAVIGDWEELEFDEGVEKFFEHLTKSLELPCDVTGIEDFRWEEFYVFGPGDPQEYEQLRQTQPSYQDTFELLRITTDDCSEWMMCFDEDIAAHVRRKSDGKEFCLGLSELEAVSKKSKNRQLIHDYVVYFVNSR